MPEYFKNHPILYAGPAKTPEGYPCGSMGPTTANRMDPYVDEFQSKGASLVMIAKGNRSQVVTDACQKHGGFYLAPSVAWLPFSRRAASRASNAWNIQNSAWRPFGKSRLKTSPLSSSSTTRATTSSSN